MSNEWNSASTLPPMLQDVLIYSSTFQGYAVAVYKMNDQGQLVWVNSTNGMPFAPRSVSHWMRLPDPPDALSPVSSSGYGGYASNN